MKMRFLAGALGVVALLGVSVAAQANTSSESKSAATAPANSVNTAAIQTGAVDTYKIKDLSVGGWDVLDNTLPLSKMGWDFQQAIKAADVSKADAIQSSAQVKAGALDESDLNAATRAKLNASVSTVTADTMVTNRPDTGTDGTVWAKDNMTRTLSLTRQAAVEASKCGSGAVRCFFYTGTIKDTGTFTTIDGAHSPNAPATPVAGNNTGSVNGVYAIEFYASTDQVNPNLVDATISGSSPSTSDWMKLAFPDGTHFSALGGIDYTWVYNLATTCETHTQTTAANTGNITGVSHC